MTASIHMKKLCVGVASVAELIAWRKEHKRRTGLPVMSHTTRMWPKRAEELAAGGSLYWVVSGEIRCRQLISGFERVQQGDHLGCRIILDETIIEVSPRMHRPFQGWRYLKPEDAPADLDYNDQSNELPDNLKSELANLGLL